MLPTELSIVAVGIIAVTATWIVKERQVRKLGREKWDAERHCLDLIAELKRQKQKLYEGLPPRGPKGRWLPRNATKENAGCPQETTSSPSVVTSTGSSI